MSHFACPMLHVTCLISNAYVDPWDMLNNFCFQYVNMSECQYFRMQIFSLGIKRKVVQNVKRMSENIMSVCQHVDMSEMQLFSLSIKMKVVQNVINKDVRWSVSRCQETSTDS